MRFLMPLMSVLLAALPSTTNYKLNSFGFGSGGTAGSSTSNYQLEGTTGEINGATATTTTYGDKSGFIQTEQANVPTAPTLTNPSNYYDKLQLVVNQAGNPTDAKFAVGISTDSFGTDIRYVKSDNTISGTLTTADYRTSAGWGSGSGITIIGLANSTTYKVRARATQGKFTESAWGPASAGTATVAQQLSFSLSTNSSALGTLLPGTVVSAPSNITANFATNADAGGNVYVSGLNGGLKSGQGALITSATADLSSVSNGFGVQDVSATAPLVMVSPYNGSSNNVGLEDATLRVLFSTPSPISSGQGVFTIKAKADTLTPAAADYAETLTVIGAAIY